jgi:hypothetical protein
MQNTSEPIDSRQPEAGPTDAFNTPLEIRNLDGGVDDSLRAWIHERLGRQLGKYAAQIERIDVRFGDINGPKGGVDRCCMVHVILSALPPVVVEVRAASDREAFDLAAGRAERATRRAMQKHGFSTKHKRRQRGQHGEVSPDADHAAPGSATSSASAAGAAGNGHDDTRRRAQLAVSHTRLAHVPADDQDGQDGQAQPAGRGAGYNAEQHTAVRNAKGNMAGMTHALEDSTTGRPSRKSTRAGANRVKPDAPLTLRTKSAVHSPQQMARKG